jgi:hypothetical protein
MPYITPLPAGIHYKLASMEDHSKVSLYPFLKVIGSLMYTALGTHPDICASVRVLVLFAPTFGHEHVEGLKHIMKYLAGTMD